MCGKEKTRYIIYSLNAIFDNIKRQVHHGLIGDAEIKIRGECKIKIIQKKTTHGVHLFV